MHKIYLGFIIINYIYCKQSHKMKEMFIVVKSKRRYMKLRTTDISKMFYFTKKRTPKLPSFEDSEDDCLANQDTAEIQIEDVCL